MVERPRLLRFRDITEFLEHADIEAAEEAEKAAEQLRRRHKWGLYNPKYWEDWRPSCPLFNRWLIGSTIMHDLSFRRGRGKGFSLLTLYGLQGAGKTVLAMYIAYEIMCKQGKHPAFKNIIDKYMVFSPGEIYTLIESQMKSANPGRKPVLIWDDAGVYASGRMIWLGGERARMYLWIVSQFQLIRSHIANLIVTTPDIRNLPRDIREQNGAFVGRVEPIPARPWSVVVYYQFRVIATGKLVVKRIGTDRYYIMVPNEIYKYYESRRHLYERQIHEEFGSTMRGAA